MKINSLGIASRTIILNCLAVSFLISCFANAHAETLNLSSLFSRGAVAAKIDELLLDITRAPTEDLRRQLANFTKFAIPVHSNLKVAILGEESSAVPVAQSISGLLELFGATAGVGVDYDVAANVVIVVGSDPYQELIDRAPEAERKFLLSDSSGFPKFSDQSRLVDDSCGAFQKVTIRGQLAMVYVFIDSDATDSERTNCFSDTVPAVVGLSSSGTAPREGTYVNSVNYLLSIVATNIIYSIPEVKSSNGVVGISDEMVGKALDDFYKLMK